MRMSKVVYHSNYGTVTITGDAAKEFIRKLKYPTEEEEEERKRLLERCRELSKDITIRVPRRTNDVPSDRPLR
jgi:hypothetical protein